MIKFLLKRPLTPMGVVFNSVNKLRLSGFPAFLNTAKNSSGFLSVFCFELLELYPINVVPLTVKDLENLSTT